MLPFLFCQQSLSCCPKKDAWWTAQLDFKFRTGPLDRRSQISFVRDSVRVLVQELVGGQTITIRVEAHRPSRQKERLSSSSKSTRGAKSKKEGTDWEQRMMFGGSPGGASAFTKPNSPTAWSPMNLAKQRFRYYNGFFSDLAWSSTSGLRHE